MRYISVIIPFYNEENEINKVFKDISQYELKNNNIIKEYIFIDDGSKDKSLKLLKDYKKKNFKNKIRIIVNKKNIGWAKSLIKGYKISSGKFSLFIPGDGEAKLCEFLKISNFDDDVIIFQRMNMSSRPFVRIIMSKIYKIILFILFPIKFIDLNGIILIKNKKINSLNLTSNSFFISAEIIIKSYIKNYKINACQNFKLIKKKKYKSTSLNLKQVKLVSKDLIKLFIFRINKILKKNKNN